MPLLIKNGEIITADSRYKADIYAEGESITRIGQSLEVPPGTEVIDAAGKYVFPGFIDPHVHIYLPFMATFAKDTHETGSKVALMGGTTTYIEMCCPNRNDDALEGYRLWKSKTEGNNYCDYTFHMAVTRYDSQDRGQLREIVADSISSFKIFFSYQNFFDVKNNDIYQTMRLADEPGVILMTRSVNAELVEQLQQKLLSKGKTGPEWHGPSRPELVETGGTSRLATFPENTGATGYVVHLSCKGALDAAMAAKARGVSIYIESVIPHFLLGKTYAERPGVEGMGQVMSPPLRQKSSQKALLDALAQGFIDTAGTDHCPFDTSQKLLGKEAFTSIPNGIPAIEDRVNLLYTYGLSRGHLDTHRFVDAASTRAAKLFGLFPRKGTIAVGTDAGLIIYNPNDRGKISAASKSVNNNFNGFEFRRQTSVTSVRGKVAARDGQFVGEKRRGRLLRGEPTNSR